MRGGGGEAKPRRQLFFAVALQQTRERLAQPWRQPLRIRLGRADQRAADQSTELAVEEAEQPLLAWRQI